MQYNFTPKIWGFGARKRVGIEIKTGPLALLLKMRAQGRPLLSPHTKVTNVYTTKFYFMEKQNAKDM